MNGIKTLLLWVVAAVGISLLARFDDVVVWADKHSGFASWVQALGSVLAIVLAIWVVQRQHRLELNRRASADRKALVAVRGGALQMMSAVAGMAQKITEHCTQNNSAADAVPPSLFNLGLMISELETVVSALGRIDHLKFEDHVMIESLMVSESLGKVLLMQASNAHTRMLDDGMPRWGGILTFSIAAYDQIKPRGDKIHAANLELAKAF